MRITNTSKVRQRIEGYGYVEPGETITVSEEAGLQLRKSPDFKEERAKKKNEDVKNQDKNKGLMNQTPTDKATKE